MKTSLKEMQTIRNEIMTTAASLGPKMHTFFCMALYHAAPKEAGGNGHGDVTVLDNLFTDLHKSQRTDSIRQWFFTNSPIRWDKETGRAKIAADGMKKPELWKLEEAEKFPFFHKEEKVPQFRMQDIEQTLKNEAKRLVESAKAFAEGQSDIWDKALEKDKSFKPARRMAEIAKMQAALGYTVTAKPELLSVETDNTDDVNGATGEEAPAEPNADDVNGATGTDNTDDVNGATGEEESAAA